MRKPHYLMSGVLDKSAPGKTPCDKKHADFLL